MGDCGGTKVLLEWNKMAKTLTLAFALVLVLLICGSVKAEELSFSNGSNHFYAAKTKTTFLYRDKLGTRSLAIQSCNKKLIDKFWLTTVRNVKRSQYAGGPMKSINATATVDSNRIFILPSENAYQYLNAIPTRIHSVMAESHRSCRKKS